MTELTGLSNNHLLLPIKRGFFISPIMAASPSSLSGCDKTVICWSLTLTKDAQIP